MSLADAISAHVRPGDTIHAAYTNARPNAALLQVARAYAGTDPRFTLVTAGMVNVQHSLVEMGLLAKVVASFAGENYPMARPNKAFQRALAEGRVTVENWSMWALIARLVAGALGVGHMPVRSIGGSSMAEELDHSYAEITDPFTGERTGVVAALRPDVVLLHAPAADEFGNLIISAPYGEAQWGSLAARRGVVATVERIVSSEEIIAHNELVRIPAHLVRAVCVAPFGAHPYGLNSPNDLGVADYVDDAAFMQRVMTASRSSETFRGWIEEFVTGVADHDGYLEKVGEAALDGVVDGARPDYWRHTLVEPWIGDCSPTERQVIAASRRITRRCAEGEFDAILSGVGLANLASWVAGSTIRERGLAVELMAEIGMFGYAPRPGEPFIFAHRNLSTSVQLTDVMTVLGAYVSGPGTRALGVLGAGEVDQRGNTNSTISADGSYIVGSGGANDIASGADEVLLTVAHDRLVDTVGYVTSPGGHVGSIVSSRGVFERRGDDFVLISYIAARGVRLDEVVDQMRAESPWRFTVADDVAREEDPSADELALLRSFDPERVFLRDSPLAEAAR